jgi:hypothetical protein
MADIEKKATRYPTDLTDEEWEWVVPFLPKPVRTGRTPGQFRGGGETPQIDATIVSSLAAAAFY